ncbi:MAG TPA: RecX family transcriptional regulator [Candidatus Saccharimonadales bacterium]|nr:RecX family transcriptional regulator [Candidatus Saccharimonadales bacterium]
MKITAIKQQVKNPERVSMFVDGKYEFSLSLDELLQQGLKNGQELDKAAVKKLKKISADGKLRARTLEWLLNRPHSTRELRDYLYRKKAEPEMIESLVNEFTEKGYLDDAKFAVWFADLQKRRGKSNRAVRSEMLKKGIARELADEVLAGAPDDEEARLKQVIEKKRRLARYRDDRQKLAKYLTSQGFDWQQVKRLVLSDEPEV